MGAPKAPLGTPGLSSLPLHSTARRLNFQETNRGCVRDLVELPARLNPRLTGEIEKICNNLFPGRSSGLPDNQCKLLPLRTCLPDFCWLCGDPPRGRSSSRRHGHCNCKLEMQRDVSEATGPRRSRRHRRISRYKLLLLAGLTLDGLLFNEERRLNASGGRVTRSPKLTEIFQFKSAEAATVSQSPACKRESAAGTASGEKYVQACTDEKEESPSPGAPGRLV